MKKKKEEVVVNVKKLPSEPKATAIWLIDNTILTFKQIGDFCGLDELSVQAIADGESERNLIPSNPVVKGQLTAEMIADCEKHPDKELVLKEKITDNIEIMTNKKGKIYTPIAKRKDKPDAIAFLLKHYPTITTKQIIRILGTTENAINQIKDKTYWNYKEVTPKNPVLLGLCSSNLFNEVISEIK